MANPLGESLEEWKTRALQAESKLSDLSQTIEKLQNENKQLQNQLIGKFV